MRKTNWIQKKWQLLIAIFGLFSFAVILNFWTPYVADDFSYMRSIATGERITNIFQIFPSVWENYLTITGRWVPHLFIQFLLMFPKWLFNLINAAIYTILICLILKATGREKPINCFMAAGIAMLFWLYVASYGQVFLWVCGSVNYLWPLLFALLYLIPYIDLYLAQQKVDNFDKKKKIVFCIYAFFFGAYSEAVSFSVIFTGFLLLVMVMAREKKIKDYLHYLYPVIVGAAGYLTMFLAPGEQRYTSGISPTNAWEFLQEIYQTFWGSHQLLLILWIILLVINLTCKIRKEKIVMAITFLFIGWICLTMLCLGSYLENRSLAAPTVFLIISFITLFQNLRGEKLLSVGNIAATLVCCYFIVISLQSLYDGVYDIYDTNRRINTRAEYIEELVAQGETEFTVYKLHPNTNYPADYGLADIPSKEDGFPWINRCIAVYYGAEMIYGEWQ